MLKIIAIVIVVAIAAFLGFAAMKPDELRVQRSTTVNAPPEKIHSLIEDFRRWPAWSPYEHKDPQMKRTFGGPERGRGATYAWDGNKDVGSGRMEILESSPSKVAIKLDFLKPFEGHNTAQFTMVGNGATTEVTWLMFGPNPYFAKVVQSVLDVDGMIGKD